MSDLIQQLLFYDDVPPERREALREKLADDPELARAFRRWRAAHAHVARRFREDLPARRLLVLYALGEEAAGESLLSGAERRELEDARPQIEQALRAHPALETVVERIREERADFEAVWREKVEGRTSKGEGQNIEKRSAERNARSPAGPREAQPPKRRTTQRWAWRAAAAASVLAFTVVVFFLLQRNWNTVTVSVGEGEAPRRVELADGSAVRLMPGATLSYVDPDAEAAFDRQATLTRGRAFFDIAHRQRQRFHVATPTAQVTVLGTRFGVTTSARETEVVLAVGKVALGPKGGGGDQVVTLHPGQRSRVAAGARPTTPAAVESLADALDWTGLFFFRNTPVRAAAERLSDHYDRAVTVAPALADEQVTGTFAQDRPLRETLETLAAALGAKVDSSGSGFRLAPERP